MGQYQEGLTLPEALEAYEKIPTGRINGVKGIGFNLQDGSDYEGNYALLTGDKLQKDAIEMVRHYKESSLVQKAMKDVDQYLADRSKLAGKTKFAKNTNSTAKLATRKRATMSHELKTKKDEQDKAQKPAKSQKRRKEEQSL